MDNFKIIYSNRKTTSLSVNDDFEIIVRTNRQTSEKFIREFIVKHQSWIDDQKKKIANAKKNRIILSDADIVDVKEKAKDYLKSRVEYFEGIMDVKSTSFKITTAKTRFGSCSYKNGLCFSYKTMLLPEELIDYVVVHELAHIVEKNHSADFYAVIEKYLPDYKERVAKLKEIGRTI